MPAPKRGDAPRLLAAPDVKRYFHVDRYEREKLCMQPQRNLGGRACRRERSGTLWLYDRANLERATGQRPTISSLTPIAAALHCREHWGVMIDHQKLSQWHLAGHLPREERGRNRYFYSLDRLAELCAAPLLVDGAVIIARKTWANWQRAAADFPQHKGSIKDWLEKCDLLGRPLEKIELFVREPFLDGQSVRWATLYLLSDIEHVARLTDAAFQGERNRNIRAAAGEIAASETISKPEARKLFGWTQSALAKRINWHPALPKGRGINAFREPRRVGHRAMLLTTLSKADCEIVAAYDRSNRDKVTIHDAAGQLGVSFKRAYYAAKRLGLLRRAQGKNARGDVGTFREMPRDRLPDLRAELSAGEARDDLVALSTLARRMKVTSSKLRHVVDRGGFAKSRHLAKTPIGQLKPMVHVSVGDVPAIAARIGVAPPRIEAAKLVAGPGGKRNRGRPKSETAFAIRQFCYEGLKAGKSRATIRRELVEQFGLEHRPATLAQITSNASRHAKAHGMKWPIRRG